MTPALAALELSRAACAILRVDRPLSKEFREDLARQHEALAAEVVRLRKALEASLEVMSGNAMHKSALVDALKLARAALTHEGSDR